MSIKQFRGAYRFLSNFYPAVTRYADEYDDRIYPNSECAYQAAKTLSVSDRKKIAKLKAGEAKRYGKTVRLRSDWENIKLEVMEAIVRDKFLRNARLRELLLATKDEELIEGNNWGDKFWGKVGNAGENHLGKILMKVRKELDTLT